MNASLLHKALNSLCNESDSITLLDHRGQILASKNPHPFDLGTWSDALSLAIKYFPLNPGDIVIFNDPFSGGNDFSSLSFLTCLQKNLDNKIGVYAGTRFKNNLRIKDILETSRPEAFRIPFTPIAIAGQIQQPILDAMCGAPMAPEGLKEVIFKQLEIAKTLLQRFEQIPPNLWNQKQVQSYFAETQKNALEVIHERASGEAKIDLPLDTGEVLKLVLEIGDGGIKLDYSGTSLGKEFFLPPGATNGIAAYFLAHYFDLIPFMNEGILSIIHVSQPSASCLSAKNPQNTGRAYLLGPRVLSTQLDLALQRIHAKPVRGINNYCGLYVQMEFPGKPLLEFYIPNGLSAQADSEGVTGIDPFKEKVYLSIESTEDTWPLRLQRIDVRNSSQGKGKIPGGRGLIQKYEFLAAGEISWITDLTCGRFPVQKHQTSPDQVEVLLSSQGQTDASENLSASGTRNINKNDLVTLASGSGGGLI